MNEKNNATKLPFCLKKGTRKIVIIQFASRRETFYKIMWWLNDDWKTQFGSISIQAAHSVSFFFLLLPFGYERRVYLYTKTNTFYIFCDFMREVIQKAETMKKVYQINYSCSENRITQIRMQNNWNMNMELNNNNKKKNKNMWLWFVSKEINHNCRKNVCNNNLFRWRRDKT